MRTFLFAQAMLTAIAAVSQVTPAFAQASGGIDPEQISSAAASRAKGTGRDVFDDTYAIVGVGVVSLPSYDGSNDNDISPAAGAIGEIKGIGFRIKGPSLSLDFVPNQPKSRIGYRLGPTIRYRSNRTGSVGDPVVDRLPELDAVVEAGLGGGVTLKKLLNKHDSLSIGAGMRWDISGKGSGWTISSSANYFMPVSRGQVIGVHASVDFIDEKNADYNYSITPEGSAASGLPVYQAHGGFQEASMGAFTAFDLNGDFLDGGLAIGAGVLYSRLYGSAAETPITSQRGSRNQWLFGGGLAYSF